MSILVADHHLKDFDTWFELFKASPPPAIGRWRVVRGIDDPNRVHVVGEMDASEVEDVKNFFASEKMLEAFKEVDKLSTTPIVFTWFEDVTPR